jgi:hypothetical protein
VPAADKTTIHVAAAPGKLTQANDFAYGSDKQVGPAYDFTVRKEPSSALITFQISPAKLAASVGVKGASPTGLFIQIYEPDLRSWVPLESTYHPVSHTVTATAPHLSLVTLSWMDVSCILGPAACAAVLFQRDLKHFASAVVSNVKDVFKGQDKDEDCQTKADPAWKVHSSLKQLSGCLISSPSPAVVHVRNPLLLPMVVRQPPGAPHATIWVQPYMHNPELSTFLTEVINWATDATVIAPRSYAVIPVQDLSTVGSLTMLTQPDALALAMDFALSILFVLPGEKGEDEVIEQAGKDVLPVFEAKAKAGDSFSMGDIFDAIDKDIEKQEASNVGPPLTVANLLSELFGCVSTAFNQDYGKKIHHDGVVDGTIEAAGTLAQKCVEAAYELTGKKLKQSFKDAVNVVDSIPELGKTIREGIQFAELGPSAATATTTAQRVPFDLTKSPFFQTPDHNIKCGLPNFTWWPDQPPPSGADAQELDCAITTHTVGPANCLAQEDFESWTGVTMIPGRYPNLGCIAADPELPMYSTEQPDGSLKTRPAYQASAGQNIDLGPVTCFVQASSVDCSSSTSPYTFYLAPDSFRSPLLPGDSVMAAQIEGAPSISTRTAVIEPSTYQVARDGTFKNISWTEWNADLAVGSGDLVFNSCQPGCPSGNYTTDKDVGFTLSDPMIVCGKWFFTKLEIQDPLNSNVSGSRSIAPETDAQGQQCPAPSVG